MNMEPSPRAISENVESVRSKLQESLAAALVLVAQSPKNAEASLQSPKDAETSYPSPVEASTTSQVPKNVENSSIALQDGASCQSDQAPSGLELHQLSPAPLASTSQSPDNDKIEFDNIIVELDQYTDEARAFFQRNWDANGFSDCSFKGSILDSEEFQMVPVTETNSAFTNVDASNKRHLPDQAASDETDFQVLGGIPGGHSSKRAKLEIKRPKLENDSASNANMASPSSHPELLAKKIEDELFKLFGGVNKKYKEKGRSLLFNLKDRNNPELRERVMSGEIAPEKLCSMTAEELASKELSQWRLEKADKFAQMVVLQDSDFDPRRLVKKTHKGEIQMVEVDHDDSVSAEVAIGASMISRVPSKSNEATKAEPVNETERSDSKDEVTERDSSNKKDSDFIQFTTQEITTDILPPIISLDEFVGCLESEPYETLSLDRGRDFPSVGMEKIGSFKTRISSSDQQSGSPKIEGDKLRSDNSEHKNTDITNKTHNEVCEKPIQANKMELKELVMLDPDGLSNSKQFWEGTVQINISVLLKLVSAFKSGEKISTEDWPCLLEVKGRVRMDAFEKFLQELRQSRSRGIMVTIFSVTTEGSPNSISSKLEEVSKSYVEDERVGFAEPAKGTELYLCPVHMHTFEMLGRHLPAEYMDPIKALLDEGGGGVGLIGIVVWKRPYPMTSISPKSSNPNQNRHVLKRHSSSRKMNRDNVDLSLPSIPEKVVVPPVGGAAVVVEAVTVRDDIDDIPPGFGPSASRDDDLPEFDFRGGSKTTASSNVGYAPNQPRVPSSSRSTSQASDFVHKYGNVVGVGRVDYPSTPSVRAGPIELEPWNDDEDDMPEWKPDSRLARPTIVTQHVTQSYQPPQQHPYQHQQQTMLFHQQASPPPPPPLGAPPSSSRYPLHVQVSMQSMQQQPFVSPLQHGHFAMLQQMGAVDPNVHLGYQGSSHQPMMQPIVSVGMVPGNVIYNTSGYGAAQAGAPWGHMRY